MLTLKAINENPEEIVRRLSKKHFDGKAIIDEVIALMRYGVNRKPRSTRY